MSFDKDAQLAFENINFSKRYFEITQQFSYRETAEKVDRKMALNFFKEFGYSFEFAENSFIHADKVNSIVFQITIMLKGGRFTPYFIVSRDNQFLNMNSGNLGFVYKHLNPLDSEIKLPWYQTVDDFKTIVTGILDIFDNFKTAYLQIIN